MLYQIGEAEEDVSLYAKAEVAVLESYQTTYNPHYRARTLYLWGYILFKQERYEEAIAKFKSVNLPGEFLPGDRRRLMWDGLYALGEAYLGLDDKAAARRAFNQLDSQIDTFLQDDGWSNLSEMTFVCAWEGNLELGDETERVG